MASHTELQPVGTMRMVTQRLLTTPTTQLPHVAPTLAGYITKSKVVFTASQYEGKSRAGSETNVLIHKLKTQLSTLLLGKSHHGRFSAIILIKATVEVGGWDILKGAGPWVRGMISILVVSR